MKLKKEEWWSGECDLQFKKKELDEYDKEVFIMIMMRRKDNTRRV